jgi:AraC-like DNA-binding protein
MVVRAELDKLGLHYGPVELGQVDIEEEITADQYDQLKNALLQSGLELMYDQNALLIEKIKRVIIEMIHYADELPKIKKSDYISYKLNHNYVYLSGIFSETTGITIEQYIINHKIEKIKELLLYDKLTLTQICDKMNYSSVAHLSNQFKKVTGLTPTYFKQLRLKKRNAK